MMLEGHEATVNTIAVDAYKIMSGSADTKVHIWNRQNGHLMRVLHGHKRSVNCLDIGHTWFASGGSEGESGKGPHQHTFVDGEVVVGPG